jgi:post-segregation antitoxin (ccd killing protein)
MSHICQIDAPKKVVKPPIDSELMRDKREVLWLKETTQAVKDNNRLIDARGTFGDATRMF